MTRDEKINAALTALNQGDHAKAATICAELLEDTPDDAELVSFYGLALLPTAPAKAFSHLERACNLEPREARWHIHFGIGAGQLNDWEKAERAFATAASLSNGAVQTLMPWSNALIQLGKLPEAADILVQISQKAPSKPVLQQLGAVQLELKDFAGALRSLEQSLAFGEAAPSERLMIANLQVTMQRYDDAAQNYNTLLKAKPVHPDAALGAANIARAKGQMGEADKLLMQGWHDNKSHVGLMAELLETPDLDPAVVSMAQSVSKNETLPLQDRQSVNFALAQYFDRQDDPEKAWHHATLGNDQYQEPESPNLDAYENTINAAFALYDNCTPLPQDPSAPDLIYCVGPPRSGGSLLQTILSAPEGHASLGERGALMPWVLPMLDQPSEKCLEEWLSKAADLAKADIAGMRSLFPGAALYTDKTPHYAHIVGLLHRLHPQAQFVDQRRNLKDVLVSIYLRGFQSTFLYSRSVKHIADYLVLHRQTMDSWANRSIPIAIHDHEAFIKAPEETGKKLFGQLGKDWQSDYLNRDNRKTTVRTFSVRQVREKISPAFSGKGDKYSEFIGPLPAEFERLL